MKVVEDTVDILGFCEKCFRMRWLKEIVGNDKGTPFGACRSCVRERKENDHDGTDSEVRR